MKDRGAAQAVFYYIKGRSLGRGRGRGRDKEESTDIWLNNFQFRGQRLEHESCKPLASSIVQQKGEDRALLKILKEVSRSPGGDCATVLESPTHS